MAKKIKLNIDFTEDSTLLGISCHKRDYFLAFQINEHLKIHLKRLKDFPFYNPKTESLLSYAFFYYFNPDTQLAYYMVSNFNPESKLFSELSSIDYFILVQGRFTEIMKKEHLKEMKKINGVLTAYNVDYSKLKDFDNFLEDLELHITEILKEG